MLGLMFSRKLIYFYCADIANCKPIWSSTQTKAWQHNTQKPQEWEGQKKEANSELSHQIYTTYTTVCVCFTFARTATVALGVLLVCNLLETIAIPVSLFLFHKDKSEDNQIDVQRTGLDSKTLFLFSGEKAFRHGCENRTCDFFIWIRTSELRRVRFRSRSTRKKRMVDSRQDRCPCWSSIDTLQRRRR